MLNLFKVLADITRLRLLRILRQGDFTVQDLMQILDMGQSRISRHLKLLTDAGLLQIEKQGTWHYYRLAASNPLFNQIWPHVEAGLIDLQLQEQDHSGVTQVMAERRRRSQDFFNRHAQEWDSMHLELLQLPDYQQQLLDMVPTGGLVVEAGVGTGALLVALSQRGERTVGLDHSPSMVALARDTVEQHRLQTSVEVRLAELNHLPFADNTVRTLVLNQVLHHAEQPLDVLKEISRVLEPSGCLVMADLKRHQLDWVRDRLADQWLGFSRSELEGWLDAAGMQLNSYRYYQTAENQQPVLLLAAHK